MASNIYIIAGGTNYYLTGPGNKFYSGSGTPWTAQANSPIRLAMSDVTGPHWTPQAAQAAMVYAGGPPFANGRRPVYRSYDDVVEQIPLHLYATNEDNALFLLNLLRGLVRQTLFTTPPILAVQPDGTTNTLYFNIYDGDIQETAHFINTEAGRGLLRATMTIRRSFAGGRLSTAETLINAVNYAPRGSGSPDYIAAYSTGAGDWIYEGSPLNIKITPTTLTTNVRTVGLASVLSATNVSVTPSASTTNVTGDGTSIATAAFTISNVHINAGVKPRFLAKFNTVSSNLETRLQVRWAGTGSSPARVGSIYEGQWKDMTPNGASSQPYIDYGTWSLEALRRIPGLTSIDIECVIFYRSTDGNNGSATYESADLLLYYDFCTINLISTDLTTSRYLLVGAFPESSGVVCLPYPRATATVVTTSTGKPYRTGYPNGTAPRYFSGASLWCAWQIDRDLYTSDRATITATHAPLWRSLRGAG